MYKFYRTVPICFGKECYPTGETAEYEFEVPEDKLPEFYKCLDKSGLMIKKGTNRIVSKPKRGFLSRLWDLMKDSPSD